MRISLIVAMDRRGVIGANGGMPWHLPADLKHFKAVTMGKPIVMGRKTHESIGRVLPGRENIVLTRDPGFGAPGCSVLRSVEEVLAHCRAADEVMIMGGAELYAQFLPRADRVYLTQIHADVNGDTYFPDWEQLQGNRWRETGLQNFNGDGAIPWSYSFSVLDRVN
jgi:dihydrofolate reductase